MYVHTYTHTYLCIHEHKYAYLHVAFLSVDLCGCRCVLSVITVALRVCSCRLCLSMHAHVCMLMYAMNKTKETRQRRVLEAFRRRSFGWAMRKAKIQLWPHLHVCTCEISEARHITGCAFMFLSMLICAFKEGLSSQTVDAGGMQFDLLLFCVL